MSSKQNYQYNETVAESVKLCRYCKDKLIGNGTMHHDCYWKWSHETFNGLDSLKAARTSG